MTETEAKIKKLNDTIRAAEKEIKKLRQSSWVEWTTENPTASTVERFTFWCETEQGQDHRWIQHFKAKSGREYSDFIDDDVEKNQLIKAERLLEYQDWSKCNPQDPLCSWATRDQEKALIVQDAFDWMEEMIQANHRSMRWSW